MKYLPILVSILLLAACSDAPTPQNNNPTPNVTPRINVGNLSNVNARYCGNGAGAGLGGVTEIDDTDATTPSIGDNAPDERIVGGRFANITEFPWIAHLRIAKAGGAFICGATILNESWILTAAHCVDDAGLRGVIVSAGAANRHAMPQQISIDAAICHAQYDTSIHPKFAHDLALLKLSRPLAINSTTVARVNLINGATEAQLIFAGQQVTPAGWGKTEAGSTSVALKAVDLNVTAVENPFVVAGRQRSETEGVCFGDSGGPLHYKSPTGQILQIGVSSHVRGVSNRDNCNVPGYTSAFARVAPYASWMHDVQNLCNSTGC